jgi:hypothetical protein
VLDQGRVLCLARGLGQGRPLQGAVLEVGDPPVGCGQRVIGQVGGRHHERGKLFAQPADR